MIGGSIIRDIDPGKLTNTTVMCKAGGTISMIKDEIQKMNKEYDNITLVVGGNDCSNQPDMQAAEIVKRYNALVDVSTTKSKKVTVSSICPRLTSDATQKQIESVNAGLLSMCTDKTNVSFVDNNPSFKLGDGSINDGYYLADGEHITRAATNKLSKNLNLNVRDQAEGVCKDNRQNTVRHGVMSRSGVAAPTQHTSTTDENGWQSQRHKGNARQRHDNKHQRHDNNHQQRHSAHTDDHDEEHHGQQTQRCLYCAESGHMKKNCRHGKPVTCNSCYMSGHKAKFCYLFAA